MPEHSLYICPKIIEAINKIGFLTYRSQKASFQWKMYRWNQTGVCSMLMSREESFTLEQAKLGMLKFDWKFRAPIPPPIGGIPPFSGST